MTDPTKSENTTVDQTQNENSQKGKKNAPIKRTVAGSLLGATIGYLATPENGKKLFARIDKEELKNKAASFGKTAKEKSKQSAVSLKSGATNLFKKDKGEDEDETPEESAENEGYETLKQENEELQGRFKNLEDKMERLLQKLDTNDEEEEEEEEEEEKAPPIKKKSNKTKAKSKEDEEEDVEDEKDEEEDEEEEEDKEDEVKNKKSTKKSAKRKPKKSSTSKKKKDNEEDGADTSLSSDDDTTN